MIEYIILPGIDFTKLDLLTEHKEWLEQWLQQIDDELENDSVSSSMCIQGILSEILLYGKLKYDWPGIIKQNLLDDKQRPLAYSKNFGKKLYKFNQWQQISVYAIYNQWWLDKYLNFGINKMLFYQGLIKGFVNNNGFIYNPDVSPTNTATRMKSELLMSMCMGIEILSDSSIIEKELISKFEAALSNISMTGYLSAEYFRLKSLCSLNALALAPSTIYESLEFCKTGIGYCDFSIESKVDDYMGVAKRTARDKVILSAISGLHALKIASFCEPSILKSTENQIKKFGKHLQNSPFDIPAFRMRDIDYPFGPDLTPFELMSASRIVMI